MPSHSFFEFFNSLDNKNDVKPVNFFYGFNEFMGEVLIRKISSGFLEEKSDFNFRRFYFDSDDAHSWPQIIEEAKSSSFFLHWLHSILPSCSGIANRQVPERHPGRLTGSQTVQLSAVEQNYRRSSHKDSRFEQYCSSERPESCPDGAGMGVERFTGDFGAYRCKQG